MVLSAVALSCVVWPVCLYVCSLSALSSSEPLAPTEDLAATGHFDDSSNGPNGSPDPQAATMPDAQPQAQAQAQAQAQEGRKRKRRRKGAGAGRQGQADASYDSSEWRLARIPPSYYAKRIAATAVAAQGGPVAVAGPPKPEAGPPKPEADEDRDRERESSSVSETSVSVSVAQSIERREVRTHTPCLTQACLVLDCADWACACASVCVGAA